MPQPDPGLIGVFALLALHLCAVYTGLGAFSLAWSSELLAGTKGKIFLKKLAQQSSALGVLFLVYTLISVGGSAAVLHAKFPDMIRPWLDAPMLAAPAAAGLGWFTVFGLLYALTWRMAKSSPGAHKFLGLLAALGMPLVLAPSLAMKLTLLPGLPQAPDADMLMTVLSAGVRHPLFPPLVLSAMFLSLGCAGGFGLVYLLMRRNRDDFGRDYYNYVARFTARFAALATACALGAQAWLAALIPSALLTGDAPTFTGRLMAGGGACALAALICWLVTAGSKAPLRTKPVMLLAALLLLAAVAGFSAADATVFLAPQS